MPTVGGSSWMPLLKKKMNNDTLISMVNQIAVFFESMPDRDEAKLDLATHLRKFWDPRMRRALLELVDSGDHQLSGLALEAVTTHRASLQPAPQTA